ncbi:MAG: PTS sugar transporter subunit IIA [Lentisphaerae bacterium]|nr:PTS sugar transporter subunit IIA [Lentisphaerota bacterium]
MSFGAVLRKSSFSLHLESGTKRGIIEEMIGLLARDGKLPDPEAALAAVLERESKMSTGMQYGVAVPHGKTPTVDGLVTAFALKKEGVDFDALDGEPSRIFVMTVSTTHRTGPHIQYLAEMSKLLTRESIRKSLLECASAEEIIKILSPL